MEEYRIIEETGDLTNKKRFYLQRKKHKLFGGYEWFSVYKYTSEGIKYLIEFKTKELAQEYVDYRIETVTKRIHTCIKK